MSLLSPQLQAFFTISECGTVQGAGLRLGLTQTGVTQRIRALESDLNTTLFTRSRRGMKLTTEGQSLLRYCQSALELEGEVFSQLPARAHIREVPVKILGPTSLMRTRIVPRMSQALHEFPSLLLHFEISDVFGAVESLKRGEAQLAVLAPQDVANEFDSVLLTPQRYVLVAAKKWRRRPLADVLATERIIDFDPGDMTTQKYLERHGLARAARTGRHFVNNNESLGELLSAGFGYGVLTEEVARPWIQNGLLCTLNAGKFLDERLALAWYPRPRMPDYFKRLIALAKS